MPKQQSWITRHLFPPGSASPWHLCIFGCTGLILSCVVAFLIHKKVTTVWPDETELAVVAGHVQSVRRIAVFRGSDKLVFRLRSHPIPFQYRPLFGGKTAAIERAIRRPNAVATVYYIRGDSTGPIYSDEKFSTLIAMWVDGREILSYAENKAAFESDQKYLYWMIAFLGLMAVYFITYAYFEIRCKRRRRSS